MKNEFDYHLATSRNLGWFTEVDQETIATKRIAIAGAGGVGGHFAEVMARLGVTKFHISDFDEFEIQNFNRQNCSGISNLHRKKVEVIREKILDINPSAEVVCFPEGVSENNIDLFLKDVDLYLDGLDFFVFDIRRKIFKRCYELRISAITNAPIGMGSALVVFSPDSMQFDEHFGFSDNDDDNAKAIKFVLGLAPSLMHQKYLVDRIRADFKQKKAPSLAIGPYLCAGVTASEAIKAILKRGNVRHSPWVLHYDSFLQKYKKSYIFFGAKNPMQKIKYFLVKNYFLSKN